MVTFFTGFPRTGKSYRGVWYIKKNFMDQSSEDYNKHQYVYTNIGGFKFDKVNDDLFPFPLDPLQSDFFKHNEQLIKEDEEYTKEAIYLDWENFYLHVKKMHEMAMADKSDEEILRYSRYHKLSPSLIIIDEAYRFYKKKADPVLVWLNGYHGHLGLDIIFIIHRAILMAADYAVHTEEFINAQAKSKQLNNNTMTYLYYDTPTASKHYHKEKLSADPEVFALYKSGDLHKPKKIMHKFIALAAAAFLFILLVGWFFVHRMDDKLDSNVAVQSSSSSAAVTSSPSAVSPSLSGKSLLRVRCDIDFCSRIDPSFEVHFIPRTYFEAILKMDDFKIISSTSVHFENVVIYDFLYQVNTDIMQHFPTWNIPYIKPSSPALSSASSMPFNSGVTPK